MAWQARPQSRMSKILYPVLFYESRYADRLPIGKTEVLENFEHETIRGFYNKWYKPENMALVIVGDIDPDETEKLVKDMFGQIPTSEEKSKVPVYTMPDHDETLYVTATDPEAPYNILQLIYKHDPVSINNMGDYRQSMLRRLAMSMLQDRLREKQQDPDVPFSFVFGTYGSLQGIRAKDNFLLFAAFQENKALNTLETLLLESKRARDHGFTQSELERTKTSVLTNLEKRYNEREKTNSRSIVSSYVYHYLQNSPAPGIEQQYKIYQKLLPGISLDEVNEAYRALIKQENRVVSIQGPQKEGNDFPEKEKVLRLMDKVEQARLEAYTDNVAAGPLMANPPKAGTIVF